MLAKAVGVALCLLCALGCGGPDPALSWMEGYWYWQKDPSVRDGGITLVMTLHGPPGQVRGTLVWSSGITAQVAGTEEKMTWAFTGSRAAGGPVTVYVVKRSPTSIVFTEDKGDPSGYWTFTRKH